MASLIESLAWACWAETDQNSFPLAEGQKPEKESDWNPAQLAVVENHIVFGSRDFLISYVCDFVFKNIILAHLDNHQTLYEELRKVWSKDRRGNDNVMGQIMAKANNDGVVDLFTFAYQSIPVTQRPFDIIFLIEDAIPLIKDINIQSLFAFSYAVFDTLKRDMIGGRIYNQIEVWMRSDPQSAELVINTYISNPSENTNALFRVALTSIGQHDPVNAYKLVADFSNDSNVQISAPALATLGHFKYNFPKHEATFNSALSLVKEILILKGDPRVWAAASALTYLVRIRPKNYASLKLLIKNNDPDSLFYLSEFMFLEGSKHSDKQWFKDLFINSSHFAQIKKGIIDNLDYVLSRYLEKPKTEELGILFLENWLQNLPPNTAHIIIEEYFNDSLSTLMQKNLTGLLITKWFASTSLILNEAANELIALFELNKGKELHYENNLLASMAISDVYRMVLRTLGYVYQEHIIHSLIWSLTDKKVLDKDILQIMEQVFVEYIGYDYPGTTYKFVQEKIKGKVPNSIKQIGKRILKSIDDYQNALDALPRLKELKPSTFKLRQFRMASQQAMEKATEAAEEKSILRQMVTTISLKAGRSSFSHRNGGVSDKMHLSSYSHSYSLPRSEVIDPIGSSIQRLHFRKQS